MAARLLGLLKRYAASTGTVAFKASVIEVSVSETAFALYWQKKPMRLKKQPVEPAILPMPDGDGGAPPEVDVKKRKKGGDAN